MKKQNKKIGAFVGKFYPPHLGHLSVIDYASNILDEVWIIISKNEIRNNQIKNGTGFENLDALLIKHWFEKHYQNNKKVKVAIFDETNLKPYPQDRDIWAAKFKKQFPFVNVKIADEGYRAYNEEYFPEYEFLAIDREKIPVHSTNLRNNMQEYYAYLIPDAREYFKNQDLNK
ncbi:MAG: hypothetical protein E7376_01475 [Clostridiales bacterium]|nr:hypothetical protein [Clostridiales bacterium]